MDIYRNTVRTLQQLQRKLPGAVQWRKSEISRSSVYPAWPWPEILLGSNDPLMCNSRKEWMMMIQITYVITDVLQRPLITILIRSQAARSGGARIEIPFHTHSLKLLCYTSPWPFNLFTQKTHRRNSNLIHILRTYASRQCNARRVNE